MIRLSLATDFALRTLLFLGSRRGERVCVRDVADFYGISSDHVSKVVQQLSRHAIVRTDRGRTGGLSLAREPEQITVGGIIELFEGPVSLLECVSTPGVCVIQPNCRLRGVLDRAGARLIQELKEVTLAHLIAGPDPDELPIQLTHPGTSPSQ
jgi:Rrf2 family nitric oxide-sensitive transcriptional repressor